MVDFNAPRSARISASRVIALMATGGEWPAGWGGLIPSLLGQMALAAAAVVSVREAGREGGGRGGIETGGGAGEGKGEGGSRGAEGDSADGGERATRDNAVARAESCAKCLQFMAEEVRMILHTNGVTCFG